MLSTWKDGVLPYMMNFPFGTFEKVGVRIKKLEFGVFENSASPAGNKAADTPI